MNSWNLPPRARNEQRWVSYFRVFLFFLLIFSLHRRRSVRARARVHEDQMARGQHTLSSKWIYIIRISHFSDLDLVPTWAAHRRQERKITGFGFNGTPSSVHCTLQMAKVGAKKVPGDKQRHACYFERWKKETCYDFWPLYASAWAHHTQDGSFVCRFMTSLSYLIIRKSNTYVKNFIRERTNLNSIKFEQFLFKPFKPFALVKICEFW